MADWPYSSPAWQAARTATLQRDPTCTIKGPKCTGTSTQADHIVPISEGGAPFDPTNLRGTCQPCNGGRQQARLAAQARLNRQPATTPSRDW